MNKKLILSFIIIIVILVSYVFYQVNFTKTNYVFLESNKIPEGESLKILQISDAHNIKFDRSIGLYSSIEKLDADIIVITGDLIDGKTRDFNNVYTFVENLRSINDKIYYVSGNHEWKSGRKDELIKGLDKRGINILDNNNTTIKAGGIFINLCGIDDPETGNDNLSLALDGINQELYTILLSHGPKIISNEKDISVDLILCGHTHGGQIRLPVLGAVVAPGQGLFPKYDKGIFDLGSDTVLYVDSGLGTSLLPIRFLNRSQISYITIKSLSP